jgi:hypothetical protein
MLELHLLNTDHKSVIVSVPDSETYELTGENGLATGHKNVDKELTNESNIPRRCCK